MNAFRLMLQSRKFWAALVTIVLVCASHLLGVEHATELAGAIAAIGGVYIASVAYEDKGRQSASVALLDAARAFADRYDNLRGGVDEHTPGYGEYTRLRAAIAAEDRPPRDPPRAASLLLLILPLAMLGGCAALDQPTPTWLAADRATYDAIVPDYRDYVAADRELDEIRRERRLRTVDTWRIRLEDAERRAARTPTATSP